MIWSISTSGYLVIPNDDDTYKAFSVNDEEEEGCMKKSACSVSKDLVFYLSRTIKGVNLLHFTISE